MLAANWTRVWFLVPMVEQLPESCPLASTQECSTKHPHAHTTAAQCSKTSHLQLPTVVHVCNPSDRGGVLRQENVKFEVSPSYMVVTLYKTKTTNPQNNSTLICFYFCELWARSDIFGRYSTSLLWPWIRCMGILSQKLCPETDARHPVWLCHEVPWIVCIVCFVPLSFVSSKMETICILELFWR